MQVLKKEIVGNLCQQEGTQPDNNKISNKVSVKWQIIYYILIGKWYMTYIAKPVKMNIYVKLNIHMLVSYLLEF